MRESGIEQLRTLSAGTLATLTGLRRYDDIERFRAHIVDWAERKTRAGFFTGKEQWQVYWNTYVAAHKIAHNGA